MINKDSHSTDRLPPLLLSLGLWPVRPWGRRSFPLSRALSRTITPVRLINIGKSKR